MLALLNDPSFLRFVGDRGVRTIEAARAYIMAGPIAMYERVGFGLYLVETRREAVPIGICGLLRRDGLADADLGFALFPEYRRQGYTLEAASAVLRYGRDTLGLTRIVAIVQPDNVASCRLLGKLGMVPEQLVRLTPESDEVMLYGPQGGMP
mgnify:CR=1 FL=1